MKTNTDHRFLVTKFIPMPTIVDAVGKYLTRCGETVTITYIHESRGKYGWKMAHGHYDNGTPESWEVCGRLLEISESDNDIVSPATTEKK